MPLKGFDEDLKFTEVGKVPSKSIFVQALLLAFMYEL
jgi:hypothetical protein